MKICFVGMDLLPLENETFVGGTSNNVARIAKALSERGHDIYVITVDTNSIIPQKKFLSLPYANFNILPINTKHASIKSGIESITKMAFELKKLNTVKKFDIIHAHFGYSPVNLLTIFSKRLLKVPSIFTLYSPVQLKPLKDRKGIYQRFSSPLFSRIFLSSGIKTAISRNIINSLVNIGFKPDEIIHLPPVVNSCNIQEMRSERDKLGIANDAPLIMYLGNWAVWKGIDVLIESMVKLAHEFPNIKLITAWGYPYKRYTLRRREILNKIEKLGLKDNIIEFYVVKDIRKLIAISDILVAPFLNTDGVADYPLAILDAMACGKPVVATNVGGIPEIVKSKETGLLVKPNDVPALTNAVSYIINNRIITNKMGEKGRVYAIENFNVERVVKKVEGLYEGIANQR